MAESPANIIYDQARAGTLYNPGLPDRLARLLTAQACHETGNFTSAIFRDDNNAFGYSYVPGAIYQAGPGRLADNGQYAAHYANVRDSTRELVDWIYRRVAKGQFPADLRLITTTEQYAHLLKQADYYGDTEANYTAGINRCLTALVLHTAEKIGAGIAFIGLLAALGYYFRNRRYFYK